MSFRAPQREESASFFGCVLGVGAPFLAQPKVGFLTALVLAIRAFLNSPNPQTVI
jgi:hypothetical protein